jgi:cytochrome c oxidase subunit 2
VSRHRAAVAGFFIGGALVVGGCLPASVTQEGRQIANLYTVFAVGGVLVAGIVWVAASVALLRARRTRDGLPRQVSGNLLVEGVWTAIPLVTVLALFVLTVATLSAVDARQAGAGVSLHVTAFRWGWTFAYPDSGVTINGFAQSPPEIVVPVGEPVHVTLDATDVNHAFFVPRFLFKRDAIPGRATTFDFVVNEPGTYPGACAEYCGVFHAAMTFSVRAVSRQEFQGWLASTRASGASASTPPSAAPSAPAFSPSAPAFSPSASAP